MQKKTETAIFAAGCFWGVQAIFDQVKGVITTTVGYTGGKEKYTKPSYILVCTGITDHAEAVQIAFDPKKVSYQKLLDIFWMNHNPTTKNRQGLDIGAQYRSAIFYTTAQQKTTAETSKAAQQKKLKKEIVTEITEAGPFYPAEDYHQKYYTKHAISCHVKLAE